MTEREKPIIEAFVEVPKLKELFIAVTFNGKTFKGYLVEEPIT